MYWLNTKALCLKGTLSLVIAVHISVTKSTSSLVESKMSVAVLYDSVDWPGRGKTGKRHCCPSPFTLSH